MRHDHGHFEERQLDRAFDLRLLRRIAPLTRPYLGLLLGAVALVMAVTLVELTLPMITKVAIDRYIVPRSTAVPAAAAHPAPSLHPSAAGDAGQRSDADIRLTRKSHLEGLATVSGLFLLLIGANFVFNFFQVWLMETIGQRVTHDLRVRLFDHILKLPIAFFNRNPAGRLVTRVANDTQNLNELFTSVVVFVFKDLFLLVGILTTMLVLDWRLALIAMTVLPPVAVAAVYFARQAREAFRRLRIKTAEINTRFQESVGGIRVIQLFLQERAEARRFENLNHAFYLAGMRQIHVNAVFMPAIEVLGNLGLALLITAGGNGVFDGRISLGVLVAFITYMRMFFRPVRDIAEKFNVMQNAMSSAERIFGILESEHPETETAETPDDSPLQRIDFCDVTFAYIPDEPVLETISLSIRAGETVALVGPTGSGKTTLTHLIPRFYDPTGGRILANGRPLDRWPLADLRSRLALVMQEPVLFSGTVRDNIFGIDHRLEEAEIDHILTEANCRDLVRQLPQGLDTRLGEEGASVSSGQRQLIAIARALARSPELIILDEATSYVDAPTEQNIEAALRRLTRSRTALIVAHRLATARLADRIVVLNKGRIVEVGSHDQLMHLKGLYYRLTRFQNGLTGWS